MLPSTMLPPVPGHESSAPIFSDQLIHAAQSRAESTAAGQLPHYHNPEEHEQQQQDQKQQQQQRELWSRPAFSTPLPMVTTSSMPDSSPPSSATDSTVDDKRACPQGPSSTTSSTDKWKAVLGPLHGTKALDQMHKGKEAATRNPCHPHGHEHGIRWSEAQGIDVQGVGDEASVDGGGSGEESSEDSSSDASGFEAYVDDHPVIPGAHVGGQPGKTSHYDRKRVVGGKRVAVPQDMYRGIWNFGWMLYEAILCAAMLAAVGIWFYYALGLVPSHAPSKRRAIVYDSLEAPARPLMLRRTATHDAGDGVSADDADASRGSGGASVEPLPGTAGRWQSGVEDESGLRELASMHESMEDMSSFKIIYSLVQGGALVLLLARFIQQVSFQPKLSVISGTLLRALPDIVYFVFITTLVGLMLSVALVAVFGAQGFAEISTISGGLLVVFRDIIAGDIDDDVMEFFRTQAYGAYEDSNAALLALAWVFILIRPLIFLFFLVMIMALLLDPYARLRQGARDAPGVHHDLAVLLRWAWRVTHGKLSGHDVLILLHKLLRNRSGHSGGGASMLWRTATKSLRQSMSGRPSPSTLVSQASKEEMPDDSAKLPSLKLPSFKPQPDGSAKLPSLELPPCKPQPDDSAKLPSMKLPSFKPQPAAPQKKSVSVHPLPYTLSAKACKEELQCSQPLPFLPHSMPHMALPNLEQQASLPNSRVLRPSPTSLMQAQEPTGHRPTLRSMKNPTLHSMKSMHRKASSQGQIQGLSALMLTAKFWKQASLGVEPVGSQKKFQTSGSQKGALGPHHSGKEASPGAPHQSGTAEQPLQPASSGMQAHRASPSSVWARRMRRVTEQMAQSFRKSPSVAPSDAGSLSPRNWNLSQRLSGRGSASACEPPAGQEGAVHAAAEERHSRMSPEERESLRNSQGSLQVAQGMVAEGHASSHGAAGQEARATGSRRRITWGGSGDVEDDELVGRTWGRVQAVIHARLKQEREQARAAERARKGAFARTLLGGSGNTKSFKLGGSKKHIRDIGDVEGAGSGRLVTSQETKELSSTAADTAAAHVDAATRLTGEGQLTREQQRQQQQQQQHERNPCCVAAPARLPPSYSFHKKKGGQQATERMARSSSCSTEDKQQCPSVPDSPRTHLPPSPVQTISCHWGATADPGTLADTPPHQASSGSSSGCSNSRLSTVQEVISCTEESVAMVEQLQTASQALRALAACVVGLMRAHAERKQQLLLQEHESERRSSATLPDSAPPSGDCNFILTPQSPAQPLSDPLPRILTASSSWLPTPASVSSLILFGTAQPEFLGRQPAAEPSSRLAVEGGGPEAISCPFVPAIRHLCRGGSQAAAAAAPAIAGTGGGGRQANTAAAPASAGVGGGGSQAAAVPAASVHTPAAEARGEHSSLPAKATGDCSAAPTAHSDSESECESECQRVAAPPLFTLTPVRTVSADRSEDELTDFLAMQAEQQRTLQVLQLRSRAPQLRGRAGEHAVAPPSGHAYPAAIAPPRGNVPPTATAAAAAVVAPAEADLAELQGMRDAHFSLQLPSRPVVVGEHLAAPISEHASPIVAARASDPAEADLAELQGMHDAQVSLHASQLRSVMVEHPTAPLSERASPIIAAQALDASEADLAELQGMRDAQRSLQVPRLHSVTVEHPAAEPRKQAAPSVMGQWAEQRARLLETGFGSDSGSSRSSKAEKGESEAGGVGGAGVGGEVAAGQRVLLEASSMPPLPGEAEDERVAGAGIGGDPQSNQQISPSSNSPSLARHYRMTDPSNVNAHPRMQHRTYSQHPHLMAHPPQGARHLCGSSTVVWGERVEGVNSTRAQPAVQARAAWLEEQLPAGGSNSGRFEGAAARSLLHNPTLPALATRPTSDPEAAAAPEDATSDQARVKWAWNVSPDWE
ncbi:hypothetical protein DUNSADRAFT_11522 [Dunaliella salina]|uniref:Polycystin cation channel PKD1/PKD2 domain-containing protein n=1 Tax=Dunaliella salina TaxID=3046 RepID=A0ABQ7H4G6_DUNSA|nr:hypothetical protein DUNSADRAFT_11522 [Dunaliella salina]|eukprot:KAF5841742.1 hypothetical protein DUNSADRAFT_11522 [Dunaliella salina]